MAERVGFEPTRRFHACQFSRLVPSTARSPLRDGKIISDRLMVAHTSIMNSMRTTQRKGDLATTQAIATFTRLGMDVSLPVTESAAYDLVVDDGSSLNRVQVKYSSSHDVDLRQIHSNSKGYVVKKTQPRVYDWLYILYRGREYLIKECLDGRRSIRPTAKDII